MKSKVLLLRAFFKGQYAIVSRDLSYLEGNLDKRREGFGLGASQEKRVCQESRTFRV